MRWDAGSSGWLCSRLQDGKHEVLWDLHGIKWRCFVEERVGMWGVGSSASVHGWLWKPSVCLQNVVGAALYAMGGRHSSTQSGTVSSHVSA